MNVSSVSVSRRAGLPQTGQVAASHCSWCCSGDTPVGAKSTCSGNVTGSSDSGTGCAPCSSQYTIGIGAPQ